MLKRSYIPELIERKMAGSERGTLSPEERARFVAEAKQFEAELEAAAASSPLPDEVANWETINDFLVRQRFEIKQEIGA